jgi:hypothetical protein
MFGTRADRFRADMASSIKWTACTGFADFDLIASSAFDARALRSRLRVTFEARRDGVDRFISMFASALKYARQAPMLSRQPGATCHVVPVYPGASASFDLDSSRSKEPP